MRGAGSTLRSRRIRASQLRPWLTFNSCTIWKTKRAWGSPSRVANSLTAEFLKAQDCVLIATNYSAYDYEFIVRQASLAVETRNATHAVNSALSVVIQA